MLDSRRMKKVSFEILKMYIASDSREHGAIATADLAEEDYGEYSGHSFTKDQNDLIHTTALRIMEATHLNLYNHLKKEDKFKEGIVSTKAAQRVIEERRIAGVDSSSISILI